jgi:hypothetical protein
MKHTVAQQLPAVAKPRACGAPGLMIAGDLGFKAIDFKVDGSTTTNLSARRLGMRTT